MSKRIVILSSILLCLTSGCTGLFVDISKDDLWLTEKSGQVILHYRPDNYSESESPGQNIITRILYQQNIYIRRICDSIGVNLTDNVLIYLYNADEAHEKIGTKGGGHAVPNFLSFYYTYHCTLSPYTDQYGMINPPMGAHEIAHVITHHLLGTSGTKLMSEGYAVWLEGGYGRQHLKDIIKWQFIKNDSTNILLPSEMIHKTDYPEEIYYPNAGIFVYYLVTRYGIIIANKLFVASCNNFIREFEELTSSPFVTLEEDYLTFLKRL